MQEEVCSLSERKMRILQIIVEEFLRTWEEIGSKNLLKKYNLWVSPATIRNDMMMLERMELIYQPYNFAWRLPTTKGIRVFVHHIMKQIPYYFLWERSSIEEIENGNRKEYMIYRLTSELAKNTGDIVFFFKRDGSLFCVQGIAYFLEKNYKFLWNEWFQLIAFIEKREEFVNFVRNLLLRRGVNVFIGEDLFPEVLRNYSFLIRRVIIERDIGYLGIIGSLKMDYCFNISALRGIFS